MQRAAGGAAGILVPAIALLAPAVAAAGGVEVNVAPFPGPVRPEAEATGTVVTVRVVCSLPEEVVARPAKLHLWIADAPPWARPSLSPNEIAIPGGECVPEGRSYRARLASAVSADAPAFREAPLVVGAALEGLDGNRSAQAEVAISAAFLSILDFRAEEPILSGPAGATLRYRLVMENFGNDEVIVTFTATNSTPGYRVALPDPLRLESRQLGGSATRGAIEATVATRDFVPSGGGVGSVTIHARARSASDASLAGDSAQVTLLARVEAVPVPALSPAAVAGALALASLAGLFRSTRRSRRF